MALTRPPGVWRSVSSVLVIPSGAIGKETIMISGTIELVVDPVDEKIEELSAVTGAWQKNRDRNRPSPSLRAAIIMVAKDLLDAVEFEKQRHAISASDEAATVPSIGNKATCSDCGEEIEFEGQYWRHTKSNPRHIAIPVKWGRG